MSEIESTTNVIPKKLRSKRFFKRYFSLIMIFLVLILAGTSVYFYRKAKNDPNAATQAEVKSLVSKVGKLMVLPGGETPTIATVSDPEALSDQTFFVDAKVGDKVLIYSNAKKAILFSPEQNKIINIAPLNSESQQVTNNTETKTTTTNKKN